MASRGEHYRSAERILDQVNREVAGYDGNVPSVTVPGLQASVAIAQVHATLATVSLEVSQ